MLLRATQIVVSVWILGFQLKGKSHVATHKRCHPGLHIGLHTSTRAFGQRRIHNLWRRRFDAFDSTLGPGLDFEVQQS